MTHSMADDHAQILQALARYTRGIDRRDVDLIRTAYWPDATDNHGPFNGSAFEFAAYVVPRLTEKYLHTQHLIGQSVIEVRGDRATVETYFKADHVLRATPSEKFVAVGRYVDVMSRRDGVWKIFSREVIIDWEETQTLNPPAPLNDYSRGVSDPAFDPSYATLVPA